MLHSPPPTLPPADLYKPERDGPEEPDWFLKEKEYFSDNRDLNKDGYLDKVPVVDRTVSSLRMC